MVIKSVNLETVCGVTSEIPENPYYEVAFAGKSNVGKSSLINGLMNRKALARTSSQPGKTQTINFYNVNDAMYLVDLPGYGYANASVEIKAKWGKMIENYLHTSQMLKAVFLLIDIRHDPSENDELMYSWMVSQGFAPIIIATKLDKIPRTKVKQHIEAIRRGLNVEPGTIILPFSAETKQGRDEIWELIDSLVLPEEVLQEMETAKAQSGSSKTQGTSGKDGSSAVVGKDADGNNAAGNGAKGSQEAPAKKARWKSTGKPVAKKTLKQQAKKKSKNNPSGKKRK